MRALFVLAFLLFFMPLTAQEIMQHIRGTVIDHYTSLPLEKVEIHIQEKPGKYFVSDEKGEFDLELPIGRYSILFSKNNYEDYLAPNLVLNSSKELILHIELTEKVKRKEFHTATVKASTKHKSINEMNVVSSRQFSIDETNRYAGSLGDPARMVQNFAGVLSNGDRRNDIIIRGNSPLGVSWRLEGIEIPNPNHFSGIGTTGGSISILNNNNLSNSDFLSGAFSAQYGNATAGVFDLRLRKGNDKKYEYLAQLGFNGAEFGAEGPLNRNTTQGGSFIVNARYSTLVLFDKLGINLGAASVPAYRDLTFKVVRPTKKLGTFECWGIAGYNVSAFYSKNYDTSGTKLNPRPPGFNTFFNNWMSVLGFNHQINLSKNTISKLVLTFSFTGNKTQVDSLYNNETQSKLWLDRVYDDKRLNLAYQINHKWSAGNQTQFGYYFTNMNIHMNDSIYTSVQDRYLSILKFNGNTQLHRAFVLHQLRLGTKLTVIGGLHALYFILNNTRAIEPRFSMRYQINTKLSFNAGAGIHHQLQPLTTYFYNRQGNGIVYDSLTNLNLDFTRSKHLVFGFDYLPYKNWRIKVEAYYQNLDQVAIEKKSTSFSTLNEGAFYYMIPKPFLANEGVGYNRGLEFTLEKFFSQHFYFLTTASLYESRYKGGDHIWRHTAFDGGNTLALLGGYEFIVRRKNLFNVNLRFTTSGGRRYSPLDEAASQAIDNAVFKEEEAFSLRYPRYLRPDIKIAYRMNRKKSSHEWGINIDNFINYQNVQSIEYDSYRNKLGYSYQVGLFPVFQYKVEF